MNAVLSQFGCDELRRPAAVAGAYGIGAGERAQVCCRYVLARPDDTEIDQVAGISGAVKQLLHAAAVRLGWSMRAYHRVLKVSRTIADLAGASELETSHVAEAIQYRRSLREV